MTFNLKILALFFLGTGFTASSQNLPVQLNSNTSAKKVDVLIGGKLFTSFHYPDTIEKPFLYPINTVSGRTLTRKFPLETKAGERTDHPHHIGLWMNYESVNGLDFWNNSYAIPADKKSKYGWITNVKVEKAKSGDKGELQYSADWNNQDKKVLLREQTVFSFSGTEKMQVIDRTTTLTVQKDTVKFADVKDGFLAIRVTGELESPLEKPQEFTDIHGNKTTLSTTGQYKANGIYLSSEGKTGNDVWGTRGKWCVLNGTVEGQDVSIAILDNPQNPGYPTYWHARGYGLFAANPLGQKVFSNGKENLNLVLKPGEAVTFKYRIIINSGRLTTENINKLFDEFTPINR
ncbi:hypothetical protein GS399_14940 [Pedobacter sp. HMF7647]|uniref:Methane oxygenase PmoA n=1 Tax=Hufsiella arboris TaxID=2695275 RepID=A0A7K1YCG1_9SPHI|nr:PmoA family protein [Hufsiella arboris]MXV52272.1 hypothetical protein [Hufsiella arboris]